MGRGSLALGAELGAELLTGVLAGAGEGWGAAEAPPAPQRDDCAAGGGRGECGSAGGSAAVLAADAASMMRLSVAAGAQVLGATVVLGAKAYAGGLDEDIAEHKEESSWTSDVGSALGKGAVLGANTVSATADAVIRLCENTPILWCGVCLVAINKAYCYVMVKHNGARMTDYSGTRLTPVLSRLNRVAASVRSKVVVRARVRAWSHVVDTVGVQRDAPRRERHRGQPAGTYQPDHQQPGHSAGKEQRCEGRDLGRCGDDA